MLHEPKRINDSCFAQVVRDFMSPANPKWGKYADASRELWGRELTRATGPNCLGDLSVMVIRPVHVQAYMDGIADRPAKQAACLSALKLVERWAIRRERLLNAITTGVEIGESDGGHTPWSESHVALAEKHAREDIRNVVILGANTGQRGSDLVRMGPTDIEVYEGMKGIKVTQQKTGREVWIPITRALAEAMESWPRRPGPFLRKMDGQPWTREQLTAQWVRERDKNPELRPLRDAGLVLHGLRGHACVRLLRAGANTRQISDVVGMSEPMVKNYTRFSDQRENAMAAVYLLERTGQERSSRYVTRKTG